MASQHHCSKKEKWKMAGVCRLYRLEQNLSKRPFPPPQIDQLVDAMVGHSRMSFLDTF